MLLEHFFISKVRIKILKLFFFNLGKSYHVRGVVREIGEEINAVRRELKKMDLAGLLKNKKEGNKLMYTLRTSYPLYEDFLSMIHKEFGLGKYILGSKNELGDIKFAVVTRAFTKNLPIEPQGVDLMIVGRVNMPALANSIKQAERDLKREILYTVLTEDEFADRKKQRDSFLLNLLAGSKVMLVGDEDEMLS